MYKIFVNEKPLFLTNVVEKETDFKVFLLEGADIESIVLKLFQNKLDKVYLYHPDEKEIFKALKEKIPVSKAAGGIVKNSKGDYLFIYKGGKWDLPKGGIDANETSEQAAIREVEEETGVNGLTILNKEIKTYHIFKRNNKYKLKVTQWYSMYSTYQGELLPQQEEGIEIVKWVSAEELPLVLNNSYRNITMLF